VRACDPAAARKRMTAMLDLTLESLGPVRA
jgi:hypothetical protein